MRLSAELPLLGHDAHVATLWARVPTEMRGLGSATLAGWVWGPQTHWGSAWLRAGTWHGAMQKG